MVDRMPPFAIARPVVRSSTPPWRCRGAALRSMGNCDVIGTSTASTVESSFLREGFGTCGALVVMSPDERTLVAFVEQGWLCLENGDARAAYLCATGAITSASSRMKEATTADGQAAMQRVATAADELLQAVAELLEPMRLP